MRDTNTSGARQRRWTGGTRALFVLTLLASFVLAAPHPSAKAEEVRFSLAVGQGVTVGHYTLVLRGITESLPSYDLYSRSALVAHFPNPFLAPSRTGYSYANVGVVTIGIAPDGKAVTGILTIQ